MCRHERKTHTQTPPFYFFYFFFCVVICGGQKGISNRDVRPGCCWQQLRGGSRHDCVVHFFFSFHTKGITKLSLTLLFHLLDPFFVWFLVISWNISNNRTKIKQQKHNFTLHNNNTCQFSRMHFPLLAWKDSIEINILRTSVRLSLSHTHTHTRSNGLITNADDVMFSLPNAPTDVLLLLLLFDDDQIRYPIEPVSASVAWRDQGRSMAGRYRTKSRTRS